MKAVKKNIDIKKIRNVVFSKTFLGALIFATSLWAYSSLKQPYIAQIEIPLKVELPEDKILKKSVNDEVKLQVNGDGWYLFNVMFFNKSKECFVDVSRKQINDSIYVVNHSELMNGVRNLINVSPMKVTPDNIVLHIGNLGQKTVNIKPQVEVVARDGYTVVGNPIPLPDTVSLKTDKSSLDTIDSWPTEMYKFTDVNRPFTYSAKLLHAGDDQYELNPSEVNVEIDVQQTAEITIDDLEIEIEGSSLPRGHILSPNIVSVHLKAGINTLPELDLSKVKVYLNFEEIMNDSTGILIPKVTLPENLEILNIEPGIIYHYKLNNNISLY